MSVAEASIEIAMSRERAWQMLSDLGIAHRYVPGVKRTEIRTRQTRGVGASRRVYRGGDKSLDETVIEWHEGHGFVLHLQEAGGSAPAPFSAATFRYWLEDVPGASGRSRMTITLSYEPRWGVLGRVLDRAVLNAGVTRMQRTIAGRLKAYYESG